MKKENKGILEVFTKLIFMTWIYFLIGFIIETFAVVFLGYKDIEAIILLMLSIALGTQGAKIGYNVSNQVKKMKASKKTELMKGQMIFVWTFITITIIVALICAIIQSLNGLLYCVCFMIGLLIWEIGTYLGYKNLEKKSQKVR